MQPVFLFGYDLNKQETINSGKMDPSKLAAYKRELLNNLTEGKPFLEPELSIKQLVDIAKIPRRYLTYIINEEFNKNFFTFINEYRVDEAKKRLADPQFKNETVLSIGLNSGFNSKSSFNALFKQYTDLTPSEYRKRNIAV